MTDPIDLSNVPGFTYDLEAGEVAWRPPFNGRLAPYTATRLTDDQHRQWVESGDIGDLDWTHGMSVWELITELETNGLVENLSQGPDTVTP